MTGPFRRIFTGMVFFLLVCLFAVTGYLVAGWNVMDALYMVVITIFGVGYGEVQPIRSPALRGLTISTIVAGYAAVIYTVGGFVQMLIDGELNKALGARKMTKEIDRLDQHTLVCGFGRMGTILARQLHAAGKPFVIIESDDRRLQEAAELGYLTLSGDATEEHVLEQAGIARAAVLATVLSDDAINVFITITAREMNGNLMIVARGENPRTEKKLLGCGANKVILPTAVGAAQVAQLIMRPTAENLLDQLSQQSAMLEQLGQIGLQFDELPVDPNSPLVNKALDEIEVRSNHGFLILGIRRADGATQLNPPPSTRLEAGDVVIVLGHHNDIPQLANRFSANAKPITYRGQTVGR